MNNNKSISNTISFLRFPMIVGIVLIHSGFPHNFCSWGGYPLYEFTFNFFSKGIASLFVPIFFFISGYLFFHKQAFDKYVYIGNLKKRVNSLLIPYILWTIIAFVVFALFQYFIPELQSGSHKPIKDWNITEFITNCFWRYGEEGAPFVGQFWFLRDLMIICLLSPIIFHLINRLRCIPVLCIGILWFFEIGRFFVPGTIGLFFFSWGAYYQITKKNFLISFNNIFYVTCLSIPLFIIDAATKAWCYNEMIHSMGILLGIPLIFSIGKACVEKKKWKMPNLLCESTFFVYAIHEPYYDQIKKIMFKYINIVQNNIIANIELILLYFLMVTIYVCALVFCFKILKRWFPTIINVLSGNRSKIVKVN